MNYLYALCIAGIFGLNSTIKPLNEPPNPIDPPKDIYEACCGVENPVEYKWPDMYLFMPNAFTPNGDGLNDYFYPHFNVSDSLLVVNFLILAEEGDTLIFGRDYFVMDEENLDYYAWNGMRADSTPYVGSFRYALDVGTQEGNVYHIEGTACRVECGEEAEVFVAKDGCFYADQLDGDGHLNTDQQSRELDSGCFGK